MAAKKRGTQSRPAQRTKAPSRRTSKQGSAARTAMLPEGYLPHDLMRLFNAMNMRLLDVLRPVGINFTQWRVMQALHYANSGVSIGAVAQETVIEQSTCSRTVDRLAERGLIQRSRSRVNPKVIEIRLTRRGIDLMEEFTPHALAIVADTMSAISADEARVLHLLLTRLYEHTRRHRRWP